MCVNVSFVLFIFGFRFEFWSHRFVIVMAAWRSAASRCSVGNTRATAPAILGHALAVLAMTTLGSVRLVLTCVKRSVHGAVPTPWLELFPASRHLIRDVHGTAVWVLRPAVLPCSAVLRTRVCVKEFVLGVVCVCPCSLLPLLFNLRNTAPRHVRRCAALCHPGQPCPDLPCTAVVERWCECGSLSARRSCSDPQVVRVCIVEFVCVC